MEYLAPARIIQLQSLDPGELRYVKLALPSEVEIHGRGIPLEDTMRPGTAFLTKPWGNRTSKFRRRMYTRSNSSSTEPGVLETFINHTHRPQADTSIWWQSKEADQWLEAGQTLDIRVTLDESRERASVFENTGQCKNSNLRLEADGLWEDCQFVCIAFGTGITPFLSYIRYAYQQWRSRRVNHQGRITLIASVRHERQLMLHQELLAIAKDVPEHFHYIPVLTRSWPKDWPFLHGRIIRADVLPSGEEHIDLTPLLAVVPDLSQSDLRVCGGGGACRQLRQGLKEQNICPVTERMESW